MTLLFMNKFRHYNKLCKISKWSKVIRKNKFTKSWLQVEKYIYTQFIRNVRCFKSSILLQIMFFRKKIKKMALVFLLFVHKSFSLISFYLHNYSGHKILYISKNFTILVFLGKQHKIFSYFFGIYMKSRRDNFFQSYAIRPHIFHLAWHAMA